MFFNFDSYKERTIEEIMSSLLIFLKVLSTELVNEEWIINLVKKIDAEEELDEKFYNIIYAVSIDLFNRINNLDFTNKTN